MIVIELPALRSIQIGKENQSSFCFLFTDAITISNLSSLQSLLIGQACFTFTNKVVFQGILFLSLFSFDLPSLQVFHAGKDSFFYTSSCITKSKILILLKILYRCSYSYISSTFIILVFILTNIHIHFFPKSHYQHLLLLVSISSPSTKSV